MIEHQAQTKLSPCSSPASKDYRTNDIAPASDFNVRSISKISSVDLLDVRTIMLMFL